MSELQAGVARAIITPPVGIPMVGFAGRGPAETVHDDLTVTALALESDGARAVVLAFDVLGVSDQFTANVRAEVARRAGDPAPAVLVCASHTHYGPSTAAHGETQPPPDVAAYVTNLVHLAAGAAQEALASLRPAQLGFGTGESYIGIRR